MLYFAYGSNLCLHDFGRWCAERGHPPGLLAPRAGVWLPHAALVFRYRSPTRGGGALDVRPCPGSVVPGVLFEVGDGGWEALDDKEGVGAGCYRRIEVRVRAHGGESFEAVTYTVCDPRHEGFVTPAPGYPEIVRRGLRAFRLPELALDAAVRNDPPPPGRSILRHWPGAAGVGR
jgi:hypothetical protein